ncbi:capsular biosynthesis protein [Peribacillus simplex]|uniref:capsular biosynthesis protein n=1 Tax=Peribacillus simplex TaxID=1478 RepID=UPI000BA73373|nr:capsular biosynthesis protein [Peribacillus simplex]PAL14205.1 hypothetical protein B8W99_07330 [Peribacillus simplex]
MQIITNIFRVAFANLITLISSIVIALVLPLFLSIESYGEYRLFLFYAGYIGFLHFGFIDAMYLKYGGIDKNLVNQNLLRKEHNVFLIYQLSVSLLTLIIGILIENYMMILFAFLIIPSNLGSFHKLFYQATGQFKKYSFINIFYTFINLLLICMLLVFKFNNSFIYMVMMVVGHIIVLVIMEVDFFQYTKGAKSKGELNIIKYNKVGIFVLLGNLCVILINSTGSWFVKLFLSIEDFAYYSFSISMMNMILLLVNAVGLTFYNFIAKKEHKQKLILAKDFLLVIGVLASSAYFILEFVVNQILPQYKLALNIIAISFLIFPYLIVINVIITNLYKGRKIERIYFKVVLSFLLLGIVINIISFTKFKSMDSLAFANLITFIIWYFYSTYTAFEYLKSSLKEIVFLILHALIFLISVNLFNWYTGLITYFISISTLSVVFYWKSLNVFLTKLKR